MISALAASPQTFEHIGTPHSELRFHGECCRLAQLWLRDMHASLSFSRSENQSYSAPGWLRKKFQWGPVQWPISWCEAVRKNAIDCGVFAAFAREIFQHQATDRKPQSSFQITKATSKFEVFPAQIMLAQPRSYTDQWSLKWAHVSQNFPWIGAQKVYHEVCAISHSGSDQVRIYDPTEGLWLEPNFSHGINGIVGINIHSPHIMKWGQHKVGQGRWVLS